MRSDFKIGVGGIVCRFRGVPPELGEALERRYKPFLADGRAMVTFAVRTDGLPAPRRNPDGAPVVEVSGSAGRWIVRRLDNPLEAEFDLRRRTGTLKVSANEFSFDSFLRILYSILLASRRGILLHSAGLSRRGRGYVFFGPSESGKTTVVRLSAGLPVLSDELVVLRRRREGWSAYGTPFWGEFARPGRNVRTRLAWLGALHKASAVAVERMPEAEAFRALLVCVFYFGGSPELSEGILKTCSLLTREMTVHRLHFRPEPSFWPAIVGRERKPE
jgi:hypothetical protein